MRNSAAIAWSIARRELRGGVKGFKVFLACLIIGVGAMAAVGSIMESINQGLARDARALLGGDVEITVNNRPMGPDALEFLLQFGAVAETVELRVMSAVGEQAALVELKGVSDEYPLFGEVEISPEKPLIGALQAGGVIVERNLLNQLGVVQGDAISIGKENFVIRGILEHEPDGVAAGIFKLGPRVIIDLDQLQATGLLQKGSLLKYRYLLKFDDPTDVEQFKALLAAQFPDANWRVRDFTQATLSIRRFLDNLSMFLTLTALTALLCGGIGVTNAVKGYLRKKTRTIAILKTMGASEIEIFLAYLMQISVISFVGVIAGVLFGAFMPMLLLSIFGGYLPVSPAYSVYLGPLFSAMVFGIMVAVTFSLWQVGVAMRTPPAELFRRHVSEGAKPAGWIQVLALALGLFFCVLVMETSDNPAMARGFISGTVASLVIFYLCAEMVMWMAGAIQFKKPWLRQGVSNIYRPSSMTHSVMMSMGIGLSVLVVVMVVEGNFEHQLKKRLPENAPSYFLLDIQNGQKEDLENRLHATGLVEEMRFERMVRGRITHIKGQNVEAMEIPAEARWAVEGDRGFTSAATPPEGTVMARGAWWAKEYGNPAKPLISLDAELASGLGVTTGDTMTFSILGSSIKATIQNLRHVDYSTMQINFATIFSPGVIDKLPSTYIGTIKAGSPEAEAILIRMLSDEFPNVSAVRVKESLKTAYSIMENVSDVVKTLAMVTVIAAILVLAGALGAMEERRIYETTILKVLGARRSDIVKTFVAEFSALSLATVAVAYVIGTIGAYGVVSIFKFIHFTPMVDIALWTLFYASGVVILVGILSNVRAFSVRPAEILRNE